MPDVIGYRARIIGTAEAIAYDPGDGISECEQMLGPRPPFNK
ncbi:hypothetical protein [Neorhizobium alkalisoli]|nr:hypothetical protein [Neorhizobium alkalisoli]